MTELSAYGLRRVYETNRATADPGGASLRLSNQWVDLGAKEYQLYRALKEGFHTQNGPEISESELAPLIQTFLSAGLLYKKPETNLSLTGEEFHRDIFSNVLPSWLSEAFSHPFWERMTSGRGSAILFSGWMFELYHYTRNANRHMPLSVAYAQEKPIRTLRAKHYSEEWNHYHYFIKSLRELGYSEQEIINSVPLPMTLALSNFMRQAAREDSLCYSICSAVLEGTTTEKAVYSPYYQKVAELYQIPKTAIAPIFAHLELDVQYGHSDLFLEILKTVEHLTPERAARVLEYGHQLVEHIWLWTDQIEKYYDFAQNPQNRIPRAAFDPFLD